MASKKKVLTHEEVLMQAFRFNQKDLEANRDGYTTPIQEYNIKNHQIWGIQILRPEFVMIGVILVVLFVFLMTVVQSGSEAHNERVGIIFMTTVLVLMFAIPIIWNYLSVNGDFKHRKVAKIQGLAVVTPYGRNNISLKVNNRKLHAPRSALVTLKHMEPYTFYYLPKSKVVVSVEPMQQ